MTAQPRRAGRLARLCIMFGACLLLAGSGTSVLFARGLAERSTYLGSSACRADPNDECWVEVSAVVVGKRTVGRFLAVDEQVVQVNGLDGLQVALADRGRLWSSLHLGDHLTLRLWRGEVVRASAGGTSAQTTASPLVGVARWYSRMAGLLGAGGLLVLAGVGSTVRRQGGTVRRRVRAGAVRAALAALCVGVAGLAAGVFTRSASVLVVTVLGLAVWGFGELAARAVRTVTRKVINTAPAPSSIPSQRTPAAQARERAG